MRAERGLLDRDVVAVSAGPDLFADALVTQGARVTRVDWHPPAMERELAALWRDDVDAANREALARLLAAHQVLIDVRPAIEVIPGMARDLILHAGPPIEWTRMSGPLRGAVVGALLYEGLASTPDEAARLAAAGGVRFEPCHHHAAVGPMAGVTTASMPVFVVENRARGNRAYSTLNEGLGKVLRYGAFAPEGIERLRWFRDILGPALGEAIRRTGGVDVRALIAQALQMGDEGHNRNRAASAPLIKALAPPLASLNLPPPGRPRIPPFAAGNARRCAPLHAAHVRDHARGEHRLSPAPTRLPRDPHRDRRAAGDADGDPAPDQHRHRPSRGRHRSDRRGARQAAPRLLRIGAARPGRGAPWWLSPDRASASASTRAARSPTSSLSTRRPARS